MSAFRSGSFGACFSVMAILAGACLPACGSGDADGDDPGHGNEHGEMGSLGLAITLGDVTLSSVSYAITNGTFSKTGTIDVSNSDTVSAVIGGLPAGAGYTVSLNAADAGDPAITCSASAPFDVTAGTTTEVTVSLVCRLPDGTGAVRVNGTLSLCPRIDGLTVNPAEVRVGGTLALAASVSDGDTSTASLTYTYSATGGTLSGASTSSAAFTCTAPGDFTVTLTVSDGVCTDSEAALVTCSPGTVTPPVVRVNEVESSGGTPGDWTELYNAGTAPANVGGWVFKDNDDTHVYTIPAGTVIPAGGYYVIEEAAQNFGLGSGDSARLFNAAGALVDSYTWTAHAATTYGRCPNGAGGFVTQTSSTKGAANDCSVAVKINEVESNGGVPGDWTELYNAGTLPADVSGFVFKDNDDTRTFALPAGTIIPPGGYYVIEEATQSFGLGAADSVRLYDTAGTLVDSHTWTAHATTTYARCPNGTGAFATSVTSTKGLANDCPPTGPVTFAWPGLDDVAAVDLPAQFTSNLSGLTYQAANGGSPAVLWAVVNGPGTLFRMVKSGASWVPDAGEWAAGKALHYTNGLGNPDSEGVTYGAAVTDGMYVATERNNDASTVSRHSVLRFDVSVPGTQLTASHDWDLTSSLPPTGANLGLEAITWIPDADLVARGFLDESKSLPYDPTDYPDHGGGLFVVGVEGTGMLHVFALNHATGASTRLATFTSGNPGSMGLEFDREAGYLWATCDDTCGNRASVLTIDTTAGSPTLGRFVVRRQFNRPTTLPDSNNEGIAIAPESECSGGVKPFFWSDDNDLGGNSLRVGSVTCGAFLP